MLRHEKNQVFAFNSKCILLEPKRDAWNDREAMSSSSDPVAITGAVVHRYWSTFSRLEVARFCEKQLVLPLQPYQPTLLLLNPPSFSSSISPKMAGIPVPFSDIAKPANDVSPREFLSLFPIEARMLTAQQLLTKDFYHVQAGISSGTDHPCMPS
jgi:hypothetical protein